MRACLLLVATALISCRFIPGNAADFDPVASVRSVAIAAGLDENAALILLEASGVWNWSDGTLDATRPETTVRYMFGDSAGMRHTVVVHQGRVEVETGRDAPRTFGWADDPSCSSPSIWRRLVLMHVAASLEGTLVLRRQAPGAPVDSILGMCGAFEVAVERYVEGCYFSASRRRGPRVNLATFAEYGGARLAAPAPHAAPPELRRVVFAQLSGDLPRVGSLGWEWETWFEPEQSVWTEVRGRAALRVNGQVDFTSIVEARPATREACQP